MPKRSERKPYVPPAWETEPNKKEWPHLGYRCAAVRNEELGTWCGYLGVPRAHPWYGQHYGALTHVEVHGGLTFAGAYPELYDQGRMLWWVGFDCAHAGDFLPKFPHLAGVIYRDLPYVIEACENLAEQAEEATKGREE